MDNSTSWGRYEANLDVRALRIYQKALGYIGEAGEMLVFILLVTVAVTTVWLFTSENFENAIFNDGTDLVCMFDGSSGAIRDADE